MLLSCDPLLIFYSGPIMTLDLHYGDDESKTVFMHKAYLCQYRNISALR